MIKYFFLFLPILSWGQSFAPEPGVLGSTAIHKDSSVFVTWANNAVVTRGPMNLPVPSVGNATYGIDSDATGQADGTGVVSLGDGGSVVLTFPAPINNGVGPDFAVFENGFTDHYIELAFVEVSSDGTNFYRFESTSEIQTEVQLTNFDTVNCRYVNNFAGKYRARYGTPFDLEELALTPGLNVNAITHVKIIDVVGTLDPAYARYDGQGTITNDPYPTSFDSGGFDLDAVGVIHAAELGLIEEGLSVSIYPNPTTGILFIEGNQEYAIQVFNSEGRLLIDTTIDQKIDLSEFESGIYYVAIHSKESKFVKRIVKM
ncbi:MAG: hypothetical protein ACJASQ_001046 [Crocinitomicaceae bacterium]|jgi:hypothetical protein